MLMELKYGEKYSIRRWGRDIIILYAGWYDTGRNTQHVVLLRNPKTSQIEALRGSDKSIFEHQLLPNFSKISLTENEETLAEKMMQRVGL